MTIKCHVYQAKNGLIYLSCGDGRSYSALTLQQITDLGVDVYALDDFNLENFREAYPASQSPQEASEEQPASDKYLEKAVGAMLETGTIQFKPFSWCFRVVDMIVTSEVFTDKEGVLTVDEDDWNGGPANCVAKELTKAITSGNLKFIPCTEKTLRRSVRS